MYRFIEAGQLYINPNPPEGSGDPLVEAAWLQRFPAEAPLDLDGKPGWRWLWTFYQKPDMAGRAPTIVPVWMEYGSLEHRDGIRKALLGVMNYEKRVKDRGLEHPWTNSLPEHFLDAARPGPEDQITIPHWIKRPAAVAGEEEELSIT